MERKALILSLPFFALALFLILGYKPIREERLRLTLFQEFSCPLCVEFQHETLPWLQKEYVDSGLATIEIIPVCYFDSSKEPFLAASSIFDVCPEYVEAFIAFAHTARKLEATRLLLDFATLHPDFPHYTCSEKLHSYCFEDLQEQSQQKLDRYYGDEIHLPTLLVNGTRVLTLEHKSIENAIKEARR